LRPGAAVGLYSRNIPEWVIVEQATHMFSFVSVPLYDTLGDDAVSYVMKITGSCYSTGKPPLL
jgi:long-chain acyl-CoA synthetase